MISQLMLPDGEKNAPWDICCQGTRVKLVAGVGADDGNCPVEASDAGGDCAAGPGDVAWAGADPDADELEFCVLHPMTRTPATARAVPVSNVRRAVILAIFLSPLSASWRRRGVARPQGSRRTTRSSGALSAVRTAQLRGELHTRHATAYLVAGVALIYHYLTPHLRPSALRSLSSNLARERPALFAAFWRGPAPSVLY
jgi:hypothetical protein